MLLSINTSSPDSPGCQITKGAEPTNRRIIEIILHFFFNGSFRVFVLPGERGSNIFIDKPRYNSLTRMVWGNPRAPTTELLLIIIITYIKYRKSANALPC